MTSQAHLRNSPYLVGFLLAALMVWSFSSITKSMDGALQQTHVNLRAPIYDLGTAIQDSAIALRHRLKPNAPTVQSIHQGTARGERSFGPPLPQILEVIAPAAAPEATSLTDLISQGTPSKGKDKGSSGKARQSRTSRSSVAATDVLGPPSPAHRSGPGQGKAPKHAGR